MNSLNKVQKWAKVLKIVCMVCFVALVVGATLLGLAAIFGNTVMGTLVRNADVDIIGILDEQGISVNTVRAAALCGFTECAFYAVLFAFAVKYLRDELRMGTPFTCEFAKKTKILAILSLALPAAADLAASVVGGLFSSEFSAEININIIVGLLLFAASAVFRYGSDLEGYGKDYSYYADN